jgi:hypothetical protein
LNCNGFGYYSNIGSGVYVIPSGTALTRFVRALRSLRSYARNIPSGKTETSCPLTGKALNYNGFEKKNP